MASEPFICRLSHMDVPQLTSVESGVDAAAPALKTAMTVTRAVESFILAQTKDASVLRVSVVRSLSRRGC